MNIPSSISYPALGEKVMGASIVIETPEPLIPDGLPEPPTPPEGHRWVYRGMGWKSEKRVIFCYFWACEKRWSMTSSPATAKGSSSHYIEAVPIETPPCAPSEPSGMGVGVFDDNSYPVYEVCWSNQKVFLWPEKLHANIGALNDLSQALQSWTFQEFVDSAGG